MFINKSLSVILKKIPKKHEFLIPPIRCPLFKQWLNGLTAKDHEENI